MLDDQAQRDVLVPSESKSESGVYKSVGELRSNRLATLFYPSCHRIDSPECGLH